MADTPELAKSYLLVSKAELSPGEGYEVNEIDWQYSVPKLPKAAQEPTLTHLLKMGYVITSMTQHPRLNATLLIAVTRPGG